MHLPNCPLTFVHMFTTMTAPQPTTTYARTLPGFNTHNQSPIPVFMALFHQRLLSKKLKHDTGAFCLDYCTGQQQTSVSNDYLLVFIISGKAEVKTPQFVSQETLSWSDQMILEKNSANTMTKYILFSVSLTAAIKTGLLCHHQRGLERDNCSLVQWFACPSNNTA